MPDIRGLLEQGDGAIREDACPADRPVRTSPASFMPTCQYCGFGYDPETLEHRNPQQNDHWPDEQAVELVLEAEG